MTEPRSGAGAAPAPRPGGPLPSLSIRPLWSQVYLPNLIIATGQGAMIPVLVYAARQVHASPAEAVIVVALNGLGTMFFDLPAGRLTARFGELRSAQLAAAMLVGGLVGCVLASSFLMLACFVALQAAGWALWSLVRLVHLSRVASPEVRGRALSVFGGVIRAGNVIGPFVFVAVSTRSDARASFVIYLIGVVAGVAWLLAARDGKDQEGKRGRAERARPVKILIDHRRSFATAGLGVFAISLLRGSRTAIVPLWAAHIGLDAKSAAAIFAFSSVIDLALFYPAGVMSDRFGRRAVVLPCLALLSVGHILVPFSHTYLTLFYAAFILGFGNGFGSGIVMTLGADLTPVVGRASFLAVWRLVSDGGTSAGPLLDSAIVGLGAIALVGPVVGVVGLAVTVVVAVWLEEPAPNRRDGRRERL